jgi:hypothetical protein
MGRTRPVGRNPRMSPKPRKRVSDHIKDSRGLPGCRKLEDDPASRFDAVSEGVRKYFSVGTRKTVCFRKKRPITGGYGENSSGGGEIPGLPRNPGNGFRIILMTLGVPPGSLKGETGKSGSSRAFGRRTILKPSFGVSSTPREKEILIRGFPPLQRTAFGP